MKTIISILLLALTGIQAQPVPMARADGSNVTGFAAQWRTAIGLSRMGFYEDFSRYPDGEFVHLANTPVVGAVWSVANTVTSPVTVATVTDDGLSAQVGGNFYLSSIVNCADGVLDATFEIEQKLPVGQYSSQSGGFTFSYKTTPQLGQGGNPDNSVHINFDPGGPNPGRYQPVGSPTVTLKKVIGVAVGYSVAPGLSRYRVVAKGTQLLIFYPGAMWEYEVSDGAAMMGANTYFYFQTNRVPFGGLDAPTVRGYTALRRMWINAPELDLLTPDLASPLTMGANAIHPAQLDIRPGNLPFVGHDNLRMFSKTHRVGGATISGTNYQGGGLYVEGKIHQTHPATGYDAGTVMLGQGAGLFVEEASTANQLTSESLLHGMRMVAGLPGGTTEVSELAGTFGANANVKRMVLKEATGTIFDSGDITQNGGMWRITVRRQVLTAMSNTMFIEFYSPSTGILSSVHEVNRGTTFTTLALHVAGVAVGDVTVKFERSMLSQPY
jgi:hypothetical protein